MASLKMNMPTYDCKKNYRQISNISHTKSLNLNVSGLVLQLSLSDPLKPAVKSRMKMELEKRQQAVLQLHLSYQQFNSHKGATCIKCLTVYGFLRLLPLSNSFHATDNDSMHVNKP